jgi:hypothetical protein
MATTITRLVGEASRTFIVAVSVLGSLTLSGIVRLLGSRD